MVWETVPGSRSGALRTTYTCSSCVRFAVVSSESSSTPELCHCLNAVRHTVTPGWCGVYEVHYETQFIDDPKSSNGKYYYNISLRWERFLQLVVGDMKYFFCAAHDCLVALANTTAILAGFFANTSQRHLSAMTSYGNGFRYS